MLNPHLELFNAVDKASLNKPKINQLISMGCILYPNLDHAWPKLQVIGSCKGGC
jgi:hypothetical protein